MRRKTNHTSEKNDGKTAIIVASIGAVVTLTVGLTVGWWQYGARNTSNEKRDIQAPSPLVLQELRNGSVVPNNGSSMIGKAVTFTCDYFDPAGSRNIAQATLRIGDTNENALYGYYDPNKRMLRLLSDIGKGYPYNCELGSQTIIENNQGSLDCAATTVSHEGNKLIVNWNLTPKAGFAGTHGLYMFVRNKEEAESEFEKRGSWMFTKSNE